MLRASISPDQMTQMELGLQLADHGRLLPVGQAMSGGGAKPGCLYQLLQGVPLALFHDYRAPRVLMATLAWLSAVLLARTLRDAAGRRFAAIYTAMYALGPWLLLHVGAFVDISLLFLPAAIHLWVCWRLRERALAWPSAALGAMLVLIAQIHGSFVILVVMTAILAWRRAVHIAWRPALAGATAAMAPLIPTVVAAVRHTMPSIAPHQGFVGMAALYVYPVLKGLAYWFKMSSPDIGRPETETMFMRRDWYAGGGAHAIAHSAALVCWIVGIAIIAASVFATWWYFRRRPTGGYTPADAGRRWLREYAISGFVGLAAGCALSPVVIQGWHVLPALPAACLPIAAWLDYLWDRRRGAAAALLAASVVLRLGVIAMIVLGHASYTFQAPLTPEIRDIAPGRLATYPEMELR